MQSPQQNGEAPVQLHQAGEYTQPEHAELFTVARST